MPVSAQKPLTPKEEAFCREYLIDMNGTAAYLRAGYKAGAVTVARTGASKLLTKPNVKAFLAKLTKDVVKRQQASADEVIRELSRVAMSDLGSLVWREGEKDSKGQDTVPGTIKSLTEMPEGFRRAVASIKKDKDGNVEVKLWDKPGALTTLARYHKLLTDKVEISGKLGLAEQLAKARKRMGGA